MKTAKVYFGNSNNGNAANFIETTAAAGQTQAMTSFSGFTMQAKVGGRNDGQTAVWQSLGSAGGLGGNTTANVLLTLLNYFPPSVAVEQVLTITGTKATGADVLTLDSILVEVRQ